MEYNEFLKKVGAKSLPLSFTSIRRLNSTPRHFARHYLTKQDKDKDEVEELGLTKLIMAQVFGIDLRGKVAVIPASNMGRSNADKAERLKIEKEAAEYGVPIIKEAQLNDAKMYADFLRQDEETWQWIESCNVLDFFDSAPYDYDGHKFLLNRHYAAMSPASHFIQVCAVSDATPEALSWRQRSENWKLQAAIYTHLTGDMQFVKICIDKDGNCSPFSFCESSIQEGYHELNRLLDRYLEWAEKGVWGKSWGWMRGDPDGTIKL